MSTVAACSQLDSYLDCSLGSDDHIFSVSSGANPSDSYPDVLLHELYVLPCSLGQIVPVLNAGRWAFPPGQLGVFYFDVGEGGEVCWEGGEGFGREGAGGAVPVGGGDFEGREGVEDVEFGQVEAWVDHECELYVGSKEGR